jgi:hypothetical protein
LIIGSVAGGLAFVVIIVGLLWYQRRQNKKLNEVKEQVSLQRMVIEAERSNKPVVTNKNSHRSDGDSGAGRAFTRNNGGVDHSSGSSGGNDNISTSITYPTLPVYSPNSKSNYNNNASLQNDITSSLSPKLPYNAEFSPAPGSPIVTYPVAVSSPVMFASPATTYSPANSNSSPHGLQSTLSSTSGPQAVQVIGGPQQYYSPSGRAPQMFGDGRGGTDAYYHEQDSFGRSRQNPQEGNQLY